MRRTRSHDPDILCYEHPSWPALLIMRPPGLAIMAFTGYGLYRIISDIAAGKVTSQTFPAAAFCTAWMAIGVGLALYRRGVSIDRKNMIFTEWWGVLFPLKRKQTVLSKIKYVSLQPANFLGIFIFFGKDDSVVVSDSLFRETAARKLGHEIAQFLKCNFLDSVAPNWDVYSAGAIKRPIADTFRAKNRLKQPPKEPWPERLLLSSENGAVTIKDPTWSHGFSIHANRDKMRITSRWLGIFPVSYVVPANEFYDLAEAPQNDSDALALRVIAENDTITFGRFEKTEVKWVKFALMKAMADEA